MKVFKIWENGANVSNKAKDIFAVITPDNVQKDDVIAAWSYAIRYSAKGLDIPDYKAAAELLAQRHPSWQCVQGPVIDIWYQPQFAENDKAE